MRDIVEAAVISISLAVTILLFAMALYDIRQFVVNL